MKNEERNFQSDSAMTLSGRNRMGAISIRLLLCAVLATILAFGVMPIFSSPSAAYADTESDLAAAQERYKQVQGQLDQIAEETASINVKMSETKDKIEQAHKDIESTQAQIDARQKELEEHQAQLSAFAVETYKKGSSDYLDVLLDSSSFDAFVSNLYYVDKLNGKKMQIMDNVRAVKEDLGNKKTELESYMTDLEALEAEQGRQLAAVQEKQRETQELLANLDDEVKRLTEQHDAELAARAAQAASLASSGSSYVPPASGVILGNGPAAAVISACHRTPSPGANWCAAWVTRVFQNAGVGSFYGDACDMYARWCSSSNKADLRPGMIIAVSSNTCGTAGRLYGHVGIYVGDGKVMENIGGIATTDLDRWISYYGTLVTPRWGWIGGIELT